MPKTRFLFDERAISSYLRDNEKNVRLSVCGWVCVLCVAVIETKPFGRFNEILHIYSSAQNLGRVH